MQLLAGVDVLLVEDHEDSRDLLEMALVAKGASVVAVASAAEALAALDAKVPSVLLSDLHLPEQDGFSLLAAIRARPALMHMPAIAVTGRADEAARAQAIAAGFSKVMVKPLDPFTLGPAIVSVLGARHPQAKRSVEELIAQGDIRGALGQLNAGSPYRFTSVLRFDGDQLTSVWSFDREAPASDNFPLELPITASYCLHIKRDAQPFTVADAERDPRTASHPKKGVLNAYCGVPILARDGSLFGSLCHYDESPRAPDASVESALARFAALLPSMPK